MKVIITGGAGFIGSHLADFIIDLDFEVIVIDNLSNSSLESIKRVGSLVDRNIPFHKIDMRDKIGLTRLFDQYSFEGVIHFAGLKSVGESTISPLK